MSNKSFRWSFSQWETYDACPAKWKYRSVLKLPGLPAGPAAERGTQIHGTIEDYICMRVNTVHAAVHEKYLQIFNTFRDHPNGERYCELSFAVNPEWTHYLPTLASGQGGVRMVLDAVRVGDGFKGPFSARKTPLVVDIGEWKSGKPKETHGDQRKLYVLGAMLRWPHADEYIATTHYVENTAPSQRLKVKNTAENKEKLVTLWDKRILTMQRDQICAPRPGMQCNWCDYAKKKGGPCVFGG